MVLLLHADGLVDSMDYVANLYFYKQHLIDF